MINYNGNLTRESYLISNDNRSFLYGDGVFETIRIKEEKILFLEDHYFRLMASLRMLRMQIPMYFTLEYFEEQLLKTVQANSGCNRLRVVCYRKEGGLYTPENNGVEFTIQASERNSLVKSDFEVCLYKDFYENASFLNSLKSTNKQIQVLASIFARENEYDASLILNSNKSVICSSIGNIFIVKDTAVITPPLEAGAINGIIRKQLKVIVDNDEELTWEEREFNPFELQKADEVFTTNVGVFIQSITKYKKKNYNVEVSSRLNESLNQLV